jgi:rhodanese-related sulfurtransferase
MAAHGFLSRKIIWPMLGMVALGLFLGLTANYFAARPLPLFRPLTDAGTAIPDIQFGEVDADFVQQIVPGSGMLLLDARAAAAYRLGHIPGALSLPLGEFSRVFPGLAARLRKASLLVAYCSGPTCNDSPELARVLWARGLKNLLLYRGGMEDWNEKGYALDR